MDETTFQIKLKLYTEKIIDNLKKVEEISDLEKKLDRIEETIGEHKKDLKELKENEPKSYRSFSQHNSLFSLGKYEKKVKELEELEKELSEKTTQLKKIEGSRCSNCKKKNTPKSCYIYLWNEEKIKKWAIDKFAQFSYDDFESIAPFFCSESCFKQSHWSLKPNKPNNKKNNNKKNEPEKQKEDYICWECHKTRSEKWVVNQDTGLEFCSRACDLEHNAELCKFCVQKCLKYKNGIPVDHQIYYEDDEKKTGTLCFNCKQKQRKELRDKLKRLEEEQSEDKEELERLKSLISSSDMNVDKNQESRIKNQESRIKNQESRIKNEIAVLEQTPNRTSEQEEELKVKKQELAELEKKMKELEQKDKKEQSPKDKSNLGLKIGLGVLAVVCLVSLVVILAKRNKNKKK